MRYLYRVVDDEGYDYDPYITNSVVTYSTRTMADQVLRIATSWVEEGSADAWRILRVPVTAWEEVKP